MIEASQVSNVMCDKPTLSDPALDYSVRSSVTETDNVQYSRESTISQQDDSNEAVSDTYAKEPRTISKKAFLSIYGQQQQKQQQDPLKSSLYTLMPHTSTTEKSNAPVIVLKNQVVERIHEIDFTEPIVYQVYKLDRENYNSLVHKTYCCRKVSIFFDNPILEFLSRATWQTTVAIWLPIAMIYFLKNRSEFVIAKSTSCLLFLFGIVLWTLVEYLAHRFVFHFPEASLPDYHWIRLIHFLVHGVHHLLVFDPYRLILPPVLLFIFILPFYTLSRYIFAKWFAHSVWPGVLVGYVLYDSIHYASHYSTCSWFTFINFMKTYHMKHHFRDPESGFGVSTPLWDYVFNTAL